VRNLHVSKSAQMMIVGYNTTANMLASQVQVVADLNMQKMIVAAEKLATCRTRARLRDLANPNPNRTNPSPNSTERSWKHPRQDPESEFHEALK
jgi:hypothetical protein